MTKFLKIVLKENINMSESAIVSKLWNFANVWRDDSVSYGDYLEQITYLLFQKMTDELNKPPYNKGLKFPKLKNAEGVELPDAVNNPNGYQK